MRATCILCLALAAGLPARADFSYSETAKSASGTVAGAGYSTVQKTYLKGQKMKIEDGRGATIVDFEAQTNTHINRQTKTYSVRKFSEMEFGNDDAGPGVNVTVKATGEHRTINGYNASELLLSVDVDDPQWLIAGKSEMHVWVSPDVPGAEELRAFYLRNGAKFPGAGMAGNAAPGNRSMGKAMAKLRKMANTTGVPLLQVFRTGGDEAQIARRQQGMVQLLEELNREGQLTPQEEDKLNRMRAASPRDLMFETTVESGDFSTSPIPDSVFTIPAGYRQAEEK